MSEQDRSEDASEWEAIDDEDLLRRISRLLNPTNTEQSGDMDIRARQGLELIQRLAGYSLDRDMENSVDGDPANPGSHRKTEPSAAWQSASLESPSAGSVLAQRYRLITRIGEGGMGTVWKGEQMQPVRREVAIKLIRPGMDSSLVLRRFELERQSLAAMEHPNIARILDAGLTDSRCPFFVMELVQGNTLLQFCDEQKLGIHERLRLLIRVTHGVQHAHQKGIIHRDLKPTNILVTLVDGVPTPKIIDFGLAKALENPISESSMATGQAAVVGTLEYMSPEQAGLCNQDIDTRADIYSLGVILYELLVGVRPFSEESLNRAAFDEKLRMIREEDPVRPSYRLSSSDLSRRFAALRSTELRSLVEQLRSELDWVVMKSLEKDRNRRYPTAGDLAADIQRYLDSEPVLAHPPSRRYRLGKFARRNRSAVLATSLVMASLLLGLAGTLWQAYSARQESRRADLRATEAEQAIKEQKRLTELELEQRKEAQRLKALAEKAAESEMARAEEIRQVASFQSNMLRNIQLTEAGKNLAASLQSQLHAALQKAEVEDEAAKERLDNLRTELGTLSVADTAFELIEATLLTPAIKELDSTKDSRPAIDATLRSGLADVYTNLGRYSTAIQLLESALATRRKLLGEDHPDTVMTLGNLGLLYQQAGQLAKAESPTREALLQNVARHGEDHEESIAAKNNLGLLLRAMGRLDEAQLLFQDAAERGGRVMRADDLELVGIEANLALTLTEQRKYAQAEPLARQVLEKRRRLQGTDHANTLLAINNLGMLLGESGKFDECESLFREGLATTRRVLGEEHPQTLSALANLGALLLRLNRASAAEPYFIESLEKSRRILGDTHGMTLEIMNGLANVKTAQQNWDGALPLRQELVKLSQQSLGMEHPLSLNYLNNLASLHEKRGNPAEAQGLRVELLERSRQSAGLNDVRTLAAAFNLAKNFQLQEKHTEAEDPLREVVDISSRTKGAEHSNTAVARLMLGENLVAQRRFQEAEAELLESERILSSDVEPNVQRCRQCLSALIAIYEQWDKEDPGKAILQKADVWKKKLDNLNPDRTSQ